MLLAEPRTSRRANDSAREYHAYGAAAGLFTCESGEVVLCGPAGTGKSRACLQYMHAMASLYPGMRGLIARKTRESITQSALVTYEDKVLTRPEYLKIASSVQRRVRQSYRYPNGSEIVVGGLDKPTKIMSTEFDMAYVQEAIELTETDWESITTRLRNGITPRQQLIADTNPDSPTHWLKRRSEGGKTLMLESRHEDNPALWNPDSGEWTPAGRTYIDKLDALTGVRYWRLRKGKWVQAEGVVYEGFDRAIHLIDPGSIPRCSRLIRSIDFGFTNPFVCQWWAIDYDARMYLYRELYMGGRTVSVHAKRIKELSGSEVYEATVADHDAEDRATLAAEGINTIPAYKAISRGIQAVEDRIKSAGDGRPRIYVSKSALAERDESLAESGQPTSTSEEFEVYAWPKGQDGRTIKETPVDKDNHGMDAMRYAVAYVDELRPEAAQPIQRSTSPFAGYRGGGRLSRSSRY